MVRVPDMVKIDKDVWRFGDGETRRLSWQEAKRDTDVSCGYAILWGFDQRVQTDRKCCSVQTCGGNCHSCSRCFRKY